MFDKKLGYYICGGIEFDSKIRACLYSLKVNKPVAWYFNNDVFGKHDWSIEPTETIDELYDARSRQLREKYDYIMLSYSGGADSHNILMSFVRQGIHIDEIVVNTMHKQVKDSVDLNPNNKDPKNAAAEYYLQTKPRLKEVVPLIPKTKITILDLSDHLFDLLENVGDGSWVLDKREQVNIAGATRFNYTHYIDVRNNFDKGKKIGLIIGLEKPRTFIENGVFHIAFHDRAANQVTVAEHNKDYTNSNVEYFYWNPTCVKMITKQVHIIKKWLEATPHMQQHWERKNITGASFRYVHERVLRGIIYTTWDNNWYQADKAVKDWWSEFDSWFYDGHANSKAFMVWKEGIDYLEDILDLYIKRDEAGIADGLKGYTHVYPISPMNDAYRK